MALFSGASRELSGLATPCFYGCIGTESKPTGRWDTRFVNPITCRAEVPRERTGNVRPQPSKGLSWNNGGKEERERRGRGWPHQRDCPMEVDP
jgi:hypothetical protein